MGIWYYPLRLMGLMTMDMDITITITIMGLGDVVPISGKLLVGLCSRYWDWIGSRKGKQCLEWQGLGGGRIRSIWVLFRYASPFEWINADRQNCADFWRPGGDVDWTQVYDVPLEGQSPFHISHL
jgi:hypothetical protein